MGFLTASRRLKPEDCSHRVLWGRFAPLQKWIKVCFPEYWECCPVVWAVSSRHPTCLRDCASGELLCSLNLVIIPELKGCSAHLVAPAEAMVSSYWRTRRVLCVTSFSLVKISSSVNAQRLLMKEGDIKANNLRNPWRARGVVRSEAESHGLSFHELCLSFPAGTS